MGRRRFIKTLSSLGIPSAAIATLSQEGLAQVTEDPENEVPIVEGTKTSYPNGLDSPPKVETIHDTVPFDRWARIQSARDARARLSNHLAQQLGDDSNIEVSVTYINSDINDIAISANWVVEEKITKDKNQDNIITEPKMSFDKFESKVPGRIRGNFSGKKDVTLEFPVLTRERRSKEQAYFDSSYRPVPGGCEARAGARLVGPIGTITYHAYDWDNSERRILGSGHHFEDETGLYQPAGGDGVGSIDQSKVVHDGKDDCGLASPLSDIDLSTNFAEDDGSTTSAFVNGTKSFDWVVSNPDKTYYLQGRTTGRNTGGVTDHDDSDMTYKLDIDSDDGDSGGPTYYQSGDEIYLCGIHNWGHGTEAQSISIERVTTVLNCTI